MRKSLFLLTILTVSLLSALPVSADTNITPSPGDNIQAAIDAISDGGTIYLEGGTYYANLIIDAPNKSFSIVSVDESNPGIIDGSDSGCVLSITNTGTYTVTLDTVVIQNGDRSNGGGIYVANSTLSMSTCFVGYCNATNGGGIYVTNSTLTMSTCSVGYCNATNGGGICANSADLSLQDCFIAQNTASYGAGLLTDHCMSCTINGGQIFMNTASMFGGGIYNYHTDSIVLQCNLWRNSASNGGGIYNSHSNVVVSDAKFDTNGATMYGGGMANTNDSNAIVTNCVFDSNVAEYGGGMENSDSTPRIQGCAFGNNRANYGAGIRNNYHADATITDCMFKRNVSTFNGGGILNEDYSAPRINNCTFEGNIAFEYGGGITNEDHSAPCITNCTFEGNVAHESGGCISNMSGASAIVEACTFETNGALVSGGAIYTRDANNTVTNCIFTSNIVLKHGGAMFNYNSNSTIPRSIIVTNCTFYDNKIVYDEYNTEEGDGNALYNAWINTVVTNCILWDGGESEILTYSCTPVVSYCDIQGSYAGIGNIDVDPAFTNAETGDFSLTCVSPCIDTGTDADKEIYGNVTDDITGLQRPQGGVYDMGAYEFQKSWSPASLSPLARTQLEGVLDEWNNILAQIPAEPSEEIAALIENIQSHIENAATLTNAIYASGQLYQAMAQMEELSALL